MTCLIHVIELKSQKTELIQNSYEKTYEKCFEELSVQLTNLVKKHNLEISKMSFQYHKQEVKKGNNKRKYLASVIVTYAI